MLDKPHGSFKIKSPATLDEGRRLLNSLICTKQTVTFIVAPVMAEAMMERNTGNRTLSKTRAQAYAKDMRDGRWQLTGEPIIFSACGILNDGQTRLWACRVADVMFETDVRFGISRDAFKVTGTGGKRTLGDVFSIMGKENASLVAGALNWVGRYERGFGKHTLSHEEGLALLAEHPDLEKSVQIGMRFSKRTKLITPSVSIFLHYVFALKDLDLANKFFAFMLDGVGDVSGRYDPRVVLRERLITNMGSKAKLSDIDIAALSIKSWNAFRAGKEIISLKWTTNPAPGSLPEAFPRAR